MNASACIRCEKTSSLKRVDVVAHDAGEHRDGTGLAERREQHVGVRVAHLPEVRCCGRRDRARRPSTGRRREAVDARADARRRRSRGARARAPAGAGRPAGASRPARTSSPLGRMCLPSGVPDDDRDTLPSKHLAFSIGTTVSAPAGIGAPVAIANASPPPTVPSGRSPISARPTIRSSTGDDRASRRRPPRTGRRTRPSPRTRTPGCRVRRSRCLASTHPYASVRGRSSGCRTLIRSQDPLRSLHRPGAAPRRCRGRGRAARRPCRPVYRRRLDGRLRAAACAPRDRRATRGSPGRCPRARSRARSWPSGSRACCPRRSDRLRTRRRRPPAPGQGG